MNVHWPSDPPGVPLIPIKNGMTEKERQALYVKSPRRNVRQKVNDNKESGHRRV